MSISEIETIINYIVSLAPALTAIISVVGALIISIKKFGTVSSKSVEKINEIAATIKDGSDLQNEELNEIKADLKAVVKENEELRKEIKTLNSRLSPVKED